MKNAFALLLALSQIYTAPVLHSPMTDKTVSVIVTVSAPEEYTYQSVKEYADFADAHVFGLDYDYIYDTLIYGFGAELPYSSLPTLESLDFVENVYFSGEYKPLTASHSTANMHAANMIGFDDISKYGLTGDGIKVAVIDSGFDIAHPAFDKEVTDTLDLIPFEKEISVSRLNALVLLTDSSKLRVSSKIPFAYDYVGNDTDVLSSSDHGTHVAGIIGAAQTENGTMHGIAPDCQLLLMKVFDDDGKSASTKALLAAMEDAVKLDADVINLSMGLYAGSSDPSRTLGLDSIIEKAEKAGCTVICASGNDSVATDASKLFSERGLRYPPAEYTDYGTVSSPSTVPYAISVASAENSVHYIDHFRHTHNEGLKISFSDTNAAAGILEGSFISKFDGMTLEYAIVPGIGEESDYRGVDVDGKIALVSRGTITFTDKVNIAADHGAVAVIVYNNDLNEEINMDLTGAKLPAIAISMNDGLALTYEEHHELTFSSEYVWRDKLDGTAGLISEFSSYGVTPSLDLKPDITAVGGSVYSTVNGGGYAGLSGTSMAAPQISGICALLCQQATLDGMTDSVISAEYIKTALLNTAVPILQNNGITYSPRVQGAGLIDPGAALSSDIRISYAKNGLAKAELYDNLEDSFTVDVTLKNLSNREKTVSLGVILTHDAYTKVRFNDDYSYYNTLESSADKASRITADGSENLNRFAPDYSPLEVVLNGESEKTVSITFSLDKKYHDSLESVFKNGYFIEGFIVCNSDTSDISLPYMGYRGDWSAAPIVDSEIYGKQAKIFDGSGFYVKTDAGFVPAGADIFATETEYHRDLIAFSPNGNDSADEIYYSASVLRNIKSSTMTVTANDGSTVFTAKTGYVNKVQSDEKSSTVLFDWDGGDGEYKRYKLPDGVYTATFEFTLDYGESSVQSVSYPIIIDTVAPILTETAVSGNKLSVKAEDETGILSISIYEGENPLNDESYEEFFMLTHSSATAQFDISSFHGDELYCEIIDYAYNVYIEKLNLDALRSAN